MDSYTKDFTIADIHWSKGKELFSWWNTAREDRAFPNRSAFSPIQAPSLLSTMQLIDVGGKARSYTARLVGTGIAEVLGFDPTGKALNELPNTEKVRIAYDWVVDNRKPILRKDVPVKWGEKDFMVFSALIVPLGHKDDAVSMLMLHFNFGKT